MNHQIDANCPYKTTQAAEFLNCHVITVRRLIQRKILRGIKLGREYRVLGSEILRMLEA